MAQSHAFSHDAHHFQWPSDPTPTTNACNKHDHCFYHNDDGKIHH